MGVDVGAELGGAVGEKKFIRVECSTHIAPILSTNAVRLNRGLGLAVAALVVTSLPSAIAVVTGLGLGESSSCEDEALAKIFDG